MLTHKNLSMEIIPTLQYNTIHVGQVCSEILTEKNCMAECKWPVLKISIKIQY